MLWRFSCCESQEKDSGPRNICQQFFVILSREIWVGNMQLSFQHAQWFGLRIPHGHVEMLPKKKNPLTNGLNPVPSALGLRLLIPFS